MPTLTDNIEQDLAAATSDDRSIRPEDAAGVLQQSAAPTGLPTAVETAIAPQRKPSEGSHMDRAFQAFIARHDAASEEAPSFRPDRSWYEGIGAGVGRTATNLTSGGVRAPAAILAGTGEIEAAVAQAGADFISAGVTAPQQLERLTPAALTATDPARDFLRGGQDDLIRARLRGVTVEAIRQERRDRDTGAAFLHDQQARANRIKEVIRDVNFAAAKPFEASADWIEKLADSDLLYQSPTLAHIREEEGLLAAMRTGAWWLETLPEYVASAATFIVPAAASASIATRMGMASEAAVALGARVGATAGFFVETGSTFDEIRDELVPTYGERDAAIMASGPALAYGAAAALIERGLLPFQIRREPGLRQWLKNFALAGGLGEGSEEWVQGLLQGVARMTVGLDPNLSADSQIENFIGGLFGGAITTGVVSSSSLGAKASDRATLESAARSMTPADRSSRIAALTDLLVELEKAETAEPPVVAEGPQQPGEFGPEEQVEGRVITEDDVLQPEAALAQ
ncbi:MAG TPA: hypothetical protein VM285_15110, partial [Polyangia bacterium]|nr:hypothetical protein [Polyangia bacterium]